MNDLPERIGLVHESGSQAIVHHIVKGFQMLVELFVVTKGTTLKHPIKV